MFLLPIAKTNKAYKFHFIGIGGIGMSGMAKILLVRGYILSGSDTKRSIITDDISNLGAKIYYRHSKENIQDVSVVIYSAAIKSNNCEYQQALKLKIPLISRAEMLNAISSTSHSIAITGTHGKTTTSSILSKILFDFSLDPLILIGGIVPFIGSNAYYGYGKYTIYEACEAYGSLYSYNSELAVITNLDLDHIDYFRSIEHLQREFSDFIQRIPFYGQLFINGDDQNIIEVIKNYKKTFFSFGLVNSNLNLRATNIRYLSSKTVFDIILHNHYIGSIESALYGKHNVYNILAAISVSLFLNIDMKAISRSITSFINSEQRFQLIAEKNNIRVFNDYAHHPTEINATLQAINQLTSESRVITIFQPHLYSRTQKFFSQFAKALSISDFVCLVPIFPAREKPILGVSTKLIGNELKRKFPQVQFSCFTSKEKVLVFLKSFIQPNDVILTLGAGDVNELAPKIVELIN